MRGPDKTLTTLGWFKWLNHWNFAYYENVYLQFIKQCLTVNWALIQGGVGPEALELWYLIFLTLELDRKAQVDLMILAHSGEAGRSEANELLWTLLSIWALRPEYEDLSHKCSSLVSRARRWLDRPPRDHQDRQWWRWEKYWVPRHPQWSPRAVPQGAYTLLSGPRGEVLAPPACWGPPLQ